MTRTELFIRQLCAKYRQELDEFYPQLYRIYQELVDVGKDKRDTDGRPRGSAEFQDCLYLYLLVREYKPKVIFEVGTWIGTSAIFMAEALKRNGQGKIYTCDINDVSCIPEEYDRLITRMYGHSDDILAQLIREGVVIDFVFADGEMTTTNVNQLKQLLSAKAVFTTHDFRLPAPTKGVAHFLLMKNHFNSASEFCWLLPKILGEKGSKEGGYDVGLPSRIDRSVAVMIPKSLACQNGVKQTWLWNLFQYWQVSAQYLYATRHRRLRTLFG